jgi:aspartyl-tRNA(Asn)/glutamyl-tRNA(Gln) amidotransferase subunit A
LFQFSSIANYQQELKQGKFSCEQVVTWYLNTIDKNKGLNAFVFVFTDQAIERAKWLDVQFRNGNKIGKLHGVVVGIKDNICYKDHPVSAGSGILQEYNSIYSATAVQRLLDEGAIIIGSLNCDEFGMGSTNENSFYGRVKHPLNESKVPGGSSGGSAVAVKTNCCMIALGSDTGGSVRQPADWCGVVGLKQAYGRISRYGLIAYASSFDQIGVLGNSIEDCAVLLEIMAGPDNFDSTAIQSKPENYSALLENKKPVRIAYFEETLNHPGLDPEIATAIKELIEQLKQKGHKVSALSFPMLEYIVPTYYVLTTAEASSNLSRFDGVRFGHQSKIEATDLTTFYEQNRSEGFGKEVKRRIMLGSFVLSAGYQDAYFTKAQQVRQLLTNQISEVFTNNDVILMPTVTTTAVDAGHTANDPVAMYLADIYTVLANLVGVPAISIPAFTHSNGMPFGLQILSNRFDETTLLQASVQINNTINKL